ncbi:MULTISPECIES: hypothetical protein [unclassified Pseudomonas]|uniref:hypothetical protein n=1 Tax=unclassified Pseudomonas TaxID=196821 RepID=UPI0021C74CF9|nr:MULTISPECIES: hypothetical protein [unclassified Pseudomonas]MCU1733856.1 hypothetical protein [Pseudomonas sp. 20P_3.2_Bac4]MCU1747414.1 hypothetical protein [Pseudomonas sp. 20P_3.2_Bac5]
MTKWLWGFDLNSDVEKRMWEIAWQIYGDPLGEILSLALAGYKRSSGFDDLTRLYPNTAGHQVLPILREALLRCWPDGDFGQSELCVEMRSRLRSHLIQYLLRRLVTKHAAPPILRDALFGVDLGQ